uniref:Leucine-rich repeat protein soc-2 homolog n=1 Tax=Ixodes ricinus TaxID=34613 RepID=V5HJR7_IXORI
MAKGSLKSRIEGNSLDLSLSELTEPPVKELAELPKATRLDLSCNKIASLPDAFCSLVHLKEVDLSKNRLKELPPNFGRLNNIQRLDLYANNLTTLPLSMCRMKNLRWLDLKDNPLEPRLKAVAGDCLDEKQCQQCAKKVVEYLQAQASEVEREKQKKLKAQREQEAILKAKQEKEAEKQRLEKKAEREKKKAEQRLKREQQQLQKLQKEDTSSQQRQRQHQIRPKTNKGPGRRRSQKRRMLFGIAEDAAPGPLHGHLVVQRRSGVLILQTLKYPLSWPLSFQVGGGESLARSSVSKQDIART